MPPKKYGLGKKSKKRINLEFNKETQKLLAECLKLEKDTVSATLRTGLKALRLIRSLQHSGGRLKMIQLDGKEETLYVL